MNAVVESPATPIAEYSPVEAMLAELRSRFENVVYPVDTTKGLEEAKTARAEIRKIRVQLEHKRVEIKAPALERCNLIDSEAKRLTAALVALENPIDQQIKREEERREKIRQEKARMEQLRIQGIRDLIDSIRALAMNAVGKSSGDIAAALERAEGVAIDDRFEEFKAEAHKAREEVLEKLRAMHTAALVAEAEKRRLEAERAELERQRAEQAERERQEAERRAEEERQRKAAEEEARARREAEEREHRERLAAEERAHREKIEAEERRLREVREAEERRQLEAGAQRLREEQAKQAEQRLVSSAPAPDASQAAVPDETILLESPPCVLYTPPPPAPEMVLVPIELLHAAEEFVARVERGEVLSKHTYGRFRAALQTYYDLQSKGAQ